MNKRGSKNGQKVTLSMLKGKPQNTSVPSIAIKFHANDEQLEELYASCDDAEQQQQQPATTTIVTNPLPLQSPASTTTTSSTGDVIPSESTSSTSSSPLRYLPRLGKRSTSVDIPATAAAVDLAAVAALSPVPVAAIATSDPWKFFTDIKGKITKSVEEKITEIKSRNQDELVAGSPIKNVNTNSASIVNKNRENTSNSNSSCTQLEASESVSDSEDLSESSISRTCGIVSTTTEGAEMSSDDDDNVDDDDVDDDEDTDGTSPPVVRTVEKDRTSSSNNNKSSSSSLKQRFRFLKHKKNNDQTTTLYNKIQQITTTKDDDDDDDDDDDNNNNDGDDIESGVEAFEDDDNNLMNISNNNNNSEQLLLFLNNDISDIDNLEIDENNLMNMKQISGEDVVNFDQVSDKKTFFAPIGFVDFRQQSAATTITANGVGESRWRKIIQKPILIVISLLIGFFSIKRFSPYLAGIILGVVLTLSFNFIAKLLAHTEMKQPSGISNSSINNNRQQIRQIPAIKEHQPLPKYEGWMNELPNLYNPYTYHITQTQSIYMKLQGNLLRISHTKTKISRRALWNEPIVKPVFIRHRIYNLLNAKIELLPIGLAKKRHWSKKYPICITLSKDQMNFDTATFDDEHGTTSSVNNNDDNNILIASAKKDSSTATPPLTTYKKGFHFRKKKYQFVTQRFSKLTEEEENENNYVELDSDNSRRSTPSPISPDISDEPTLSSVDLPSKIPSSDVGMTTTSPDDLYDDALDEEDTTSFVEESTSSIVVSDENPSSSSSSVTNTTKIFLFSRTDREKENWFRRLTKATHRDNNNLMSNILLDSQIIELDYMKLMQNYVMKTTKLTRNLSTNILWLNAFIGRVLFDCLRDPEFTLRVKERIQRKLSVIKLPYFIEELLLTELQLGQTVPIIHKATKPILDDKGLWFDLNITYDGLVVLILQTKLNLMKLKQPHSDDKIIVDERPAMFNSDVDDSAESSTDDEATTNLYQQTTTKKNNSVDSAVTSSATLTSTTSTAPIQHISGGSSNKSKKFIKMVDKIAESKLFQAATENRYIKKAMEGVSNTDLRLRVEVKSLIGTAVLNIPAPPSDRIWIGFRPIPDLLLTAQPIVGERSITYNHVISWIEKKLLLEFQKIMVIPNMEDFTIPVMNPKLPE